MKSLLSNTALLQRRQPDISELARAMQQSLGGYCTTSATAVKVNWVASG